MASKRWRERYRSGGACDFQQNYDFYFKWLTNKVSSLITLGNLPKTIDSAFVKSNLILDGYMCFTDFPDVKPGLFAVLGNFGGEPDEYYIPTIFTASNPILGSKTVRYRPLREEEPNGVVVFNTAIDSLREDCLCSGMYELINQTAAILADNIVSINTAQITTRATAFFTAESEAQALAGEEVLKGIFAGQPYRILRSDIVEKLQVSPLAQTASSQMMTELVELNNYIIANFFQSIGVMANKTMKRERMITGEIDEQNGFVELNLFEMVSSWKAGFDKVNEMFGTEITVGVNSLILEDIISKFGGASDPAAKPASDPGVKDDPDPDVDPAAESDPGQDPDVEPAADPVVDPAAEPEAGPDEVADQIQSEEEIVEVIADQINGEEVEDNASNNEESLSEEDGPEMVGE